MQYINRLVETPALSNERVAGASVSWSDGSLRYSVSEFGIKDTSNTDLFALNGELVGSFGITRATRSRWILKPLPPKAALGSMGEVTQKMSAHSKVDWATGELLYFDYNDTPPYMTYGVANAKGEVVHEVPIDLPGARLPHDIGFTRKHTILHDLPFFHDLGVLQKHKMRVLTFHRDIPTRFGVIPRFGDSKAIRWFECEPCYILHVPIAGRRATGWLWTVAAQ